MIVTVYEYSLEDYRYTGLNYEVDIDIPENTNLFELNWPDGKTHVKPLVVIENNTIQVFDPVSKKWTLEAYFPFYKYYLIDENNFLIDRQPRYGKVKESLEYLLQFPTFLPLHTMINPVFDKTNNKWKETATLEILKKKKVQQLDIEYEETIKNGYQSSSGYKLKIESADIAMWEYGLKMLNSNFEMLVKNMIEQGMTRTDAEINASMLITLPYIKDYNDVVHKNIPYEICLNIAQEIATFINNLWLHKAELILYIQECEDFNVIQSITLNSDTNYILGE